MPKKSESIATKIALKLNNNGYSLDPLTIIMIAGLIVNVVRLVYECRKDRQATAYRLKHPSLFDKLVLRKQVGQFCQDKNIDARHLFKELLGWNLSSTEVESLLNEVEKND
jgi:hypothetical protein